MLALDVPFVPDGEYPDFLADHAHPVTSVHFSLHDPNLSDARQLMDRHDLNTILSGLGKLGVAARFVLMNARLHAPEKYFNGSGLDTTAHRLETLLDSAEIGRASCRDRVLRLV